MRVQCSRCGHIKSFTYTEKNIKNTLFEGWNSYGDALYCPECVNTWEERNGAEKPLWGQEHTRKNIDKIHDLNKKRS